MRQRMQLIDACLSIKPANRALTHAATGGRKWTHEEDAAEEEEGRGREGGGGGGGEGEEEGRGVCGVGGVGGVGGGGVTLTLVAAYVQANVTRSGGGVRRGYVAREGGCHAHKQAEGRGG